MRMKTWKKKPTHRPRLQDLVHPKQHQKHQATQEDVHEHPTERQTWSKSAWAFTSLLLSSWEMASSAQNAAPRTQLMKRNTASVSSARGDEGRGAAFVLSHWWGTRGTTWQLSVPTSHLRLQAPACAAIIWGGKNHARHRLQPSDD